GGVFLISSGRSATVSVYLYRIEPTKDPPRRVISADAASTAANAMLRETPNAMSRRRSGDRPMMEYGCGQSRSWKDRSARSGATERWDVVWKFRLPGEWASREPVVNARTGRATVVLCGTGRCDLADFAEEK